MRNPPDDGADQRRTRRRHRAGGAPAAFDEHSAARTGRHSAAAAPVFAPGYENGRDDSDVRSTASGGYARPPAWYGSTADGAAGKGPVRGYPPAPGQPPPMYPPGQFAAWNRSHGGRHGAPPSQPGQSGGGPSSGNWPIAPAGTTSASGYYQRDQGPEAEPGYPLLAVSDPAADVTSTQTWKAVAEGRATGTWTAPPVPDVGPGRPRTDPGRPRTDPGRPRTDPGRPRTDPGRPVAGPGAGPGSGPAIAELSPVGRRPLPVREPGTQLGLQTQPGGRRAAGRTEPPPDAQLVAPDAARRQARGRGTHTGPQTAPRSRRKRPASVKLAMVCALLLVLAAAAALSYAVLRNPAKPSSSAGSKNTASTSPSPTPSLGPYGKIGSRKVDPVPLTVAQLYPASFTATAGPKVLLTKSNLSSDCSGNVVGANLQSAVSSGCTQVVRATYLSNNGLMGTIGVLNLSTAKAAKAAARSADASDYITQLAAAHGPTHKIGQGTGIEEALAKGHYLILVWAEFTNLRKPKAGAQTTAVETFMTELVQNTANVSLSNRMARGVP